MTPNILVVDDDRDFMETCVESLRRAGWSAIGVCTPEEALAHIQASEEWDVVVVDEHLRGQQGPAMAADLVQQWTTLRPELRAIVMTAYATEANIRVGFRSGVYDYLIKDGFFTTFLLVKVGRILDAAQAARLRRTTKAELEKKIRTVWDEARTTTDRHRKGRALEEAIVLLLQTLPGWYIANKNVSDGKEELDIVIRNESPDPFFSKLGTYFFVECKNWSTSVGRDEADVFGRKLERHRVNTHTGLFISMGEITAPAREEFARIQEKNLRVVILDPSAIQQLIDAPDRSAWLKQCFDGAILPRA